MRAIWHGAVLAGNDDTVVVGRSHASMPPRLPPFLSGGFGYRPERSW